MPRSGQYKVENRADSSVQEESRASRLAHLGKHIWAPELQGWRLSRVRAKGGGCIGCVMGVCATQQLPHGRFCHCIIVYLHLRHDWGTCWAGHGQAALPWRWSSSSTPMGDGIWDSMLLDALTQGAVAGLGSHPRREINIANCVLRLKPSLLGACVCCCIQAFNQTVQGHMWRCWEPATFLKQAYPSPVAGAKSVAIISSLWQSKAVADATEKIGVKQLAATPLPQLEVGCGKLGGRNICMSLPGSPFA